MYSNTNCFCRSSAGWTFTIWMLSNPTAFQIPGSNFRQNLAPHAFGLMASCIWPSSKGAGPRMRSFSSPALPPSPIPTQPTHSPVNASVSPSIKRGNGYFYTFVRYFQIYEWKPLMAKFCLMLHCNSGEYPLKLLQMNTVQLCTKSSPMQV